MDRARFALGTIPTRERREYRQQARLSHFLWSLDTERCKPGRQNCHDALHQGKASQGHLWIIPDNEA
jgi:hypothetical protein